MAAPAAVGCAPYHCRRHHVVVHVFGPRQNNRTDLIVQFTEYLVLLTSLRPKFAAVVFGENGRGSRKQAARAWNAALGNIFVSDTENGLACRRKAGTGCLCASNPRANCFSVPRRYMFIW